MRDALQDRLRELRKPPAPQSGRDRLWARLTVVVFALLLLLMGVGGLSSLLQGEFGKAPHKVALLALGSLYVLLALSAVDLMWLEARGLRGGSAYFHGVLGKVRLVVLLVSATIFSFGMAIAAVVSTPSARSQSGAAQLFVLLPVIECFVVYKSLRAFWVLHFGSAAARSALLTTRVGDLARALRTRAPDDPLLSRVPPELLGP